MTLRAQPKTMHHAPFFNDVHSHLQNLMAEISRVREGVDKHEVWHKQSCDKLRKELEQERFESRESMNKFRYEFDELVHKRAETVLEGLEEMEQNQKHKDRAQQQQLDTLESEMQNLKVNLGGVNTAWRRYKDNYKKRTKLAQQCESKKSTEQRNTLFNKLTTIQMEDEERKKYEVAEVMRVRLKGAAQFMKGADWERVITSVDADGSGQIGFPEFRKLCRGELRMAEPDSYLRVVFESLDEDGSGEVSVEELLQYVADPGQRMRTRLKNAVESMGSDWARLLHEQDKDGSGQISFDEFRDFCRLQLKLLDHNVHLQAVFSSVDDDNSGEVSISELSKWVNAV